MNLKIVLALIPLLPLAGSVVNGLAGRWTGKRAHWIALAAALGAFALSTMAFIDVLAHPGPRVFEMFPWIFSGELKLSVSFLLDPLSAVMLLVVTGVGFLVHWFSVGYMHDDAGYARYFSYLNLFLFSMLTLVLGASYPVMFVGWEGVGLCSYLLIGFWFHKPSASTAANKAFIVNRIGDAGFILGMFLLYTAVGSFDYQDVFAAVHHLPQGLVTAAAICLFIGACGKSAQLPLYVWLPDAMEGPTPVSALIHAATMVTAGVYMVARNHAIFLASPLAMTVVTTVGITTAFAAGFIALTQTDIKKVLAYSTVSQLGYMFVGCGVGAFIPAIFHLVTHAFFKGLLFLGSGSVIHALHGEQDMMKMGGLRKHLPITHPTFLAGSLALAGIFPFAGFWSKDEILSEAFKGGHFAVWALALLTAGMTAFYTFRMVFLTFYGKARFDDHKKHPHEAPASMAFPLVKLALLSAVAGALLGWPPENGLIHKFLGPVFQTHHAVAHHGAAVNPVVLMVVSVAVALVGVAFAWMIYLQKPDLAGSLGRRLAPLYAASSNKLWIDDFYRYAFVKGTQKNAELFRQVDVRVVDGAVNGAAALTLANAAASLRFDTGVIDGAANGISSTLRAWAGQLRRLQNGVAQNYALAMVTGVIVFIGWFFSQAR